MSPLLLMVATTLTVLLSSAFALLISLARKREPRATIRNMLYANVFSLLVYVCFWLVMFNAVIGLMTAVIMFVAAALYIVVSRPTWSQVAADGIVALALLALVFGVFGVVG